MDVGMRTSYEGASILLEEGKMEERVIWLEGNRDSGRIRGRLEI